MSLSRGLCWEVSVQGFFLYRDLCPRGCLCPGGLFRGAGLRPESRSPPPVDRLTERCKNITFSQLRLRAVIKSMSERKFIFFLFDGNGFSANPMFLSFFDFRDLLIPQTMLKEFKSERQFRIADVP